MQEREEEQKGMGGNRDMHGGQQGKGLLASKGGMRNNLMSLNSLSQVLNSSHISILSTNLVNSDVGL